jgi:predicted DNA-binding protein (UPF0251 family)
VSRPPLPRHVYCQTAGLGFRPLGRPACGADAISIAVDELEALRLADIEELYQDAAAERMGVSRQTYARILGRARSAVARSLIERKMLLVGTGNSRAIVESEPIPRTCPVHSGPQRHGRACHCPDGMAEALAPCRGTGYRHRGPFRQTASSKD